MKSTEGVYIWEDECRKTCIETKRKNFFELSIKPKLTENN